MYKYLLIMLPITINAGPYAELGLGVPLFPEYGYTPDMYGVVGIGYLHQIDKLVALDVSFVHRSLTGTDPCNNNNCRGDNSVETKLRYTW